MDITRRCALRTLRTLLCTRNDQNQYAQTGTRRMSERRLVMTGVQPSGSLHVGNYLSVMRRVARLQAAGDEVLFMVADLHALTSRRSAEEVQRSALEVAAAAIASGLDPARAVLFRQSAVPLHGQLCWALSCVATQARLAHLPQYKERSLQDGRDEMGALLYPVLQAADILLYGATHVPVGVDQLQHLQLATQLVRSFHHRFGGKVFITPKPLLPDDGADRIRSLRDPLKKMSKSEPDPKSRILLTDSSEVIERKVLKAVTDCTPEVSFDPELRPGVSNLVQLHALCSDASVERVVSDARDLTTHQYKAVVAEAVKRELAPVREHMVALLANPEALRSVLATGAEVANRRAHDTWTRVTALTGLCDQMPALSWPSVNSSVAA